MEPTSCGADEPLTGSYFISTYPPFSLWDAAGAEAFRQRLEVPSPSTVPLGLYVHVPFCIERCHYCYYLSHDDRPSEIGPYLGSLDRELSWLSGATAVAGRPLAFLYFGGGTPSLLTARQLEALFRSVRRFPWAEQTEVTFECAPRSATADRLRTLRAAGVSRLSLGVQQLDDRVLKANGRVHSVRDVERAWERIRTNGFGTVNVDLIAGLVGEDDASFDGSLARVISLSPDSVTIYPLEIPRNTPLFRSVSGGIDPAPPGWETKRARLRRAFERLEAAGYHVRSAYSLVRQPERHRFLYQDDQYHGADLLGAGASSFSYLGGVHHQNLASLGDYRRAVEGGDPPLWRGRALTDEERLVREFCLQLKLGRADRRRLRDRFGVDPGERFRAPLEDAAGRGWVEVDATEVRMTRDGLLRVDRLLPSFYLPEHRNVRYS